MHRLAEKKLSNIRHSVSMEVARGTDHMSRFTCRSRGSMLLRLPRLDVIQQ